MGMLRATHSSLETDTKTAVPALFNAYMTPTSMIEQPTKTTRVHTKHQHTNGLVKIIRLHPHRFLFEAIVEELATGFVLVRRPDAHTTSGLFFAFGLLALLLEIDHEKKD